MKKRIVKALAVAAIAICSSYAGSSLASQSDQQSRATEWGVVHMGWNGSEPKVESGNLKIKFIGSTSSEMQEGRYIYTFMQEAELERKPKLIMVGGCSIVENLDTSGGDAGVFHLPDTRKIAIYMNIEESFLINPRLCMNVQY
jgi:hypothetical protein